jgi:hypothetical protein
MVGAQLGRLGRHAAEFLLELRLTKDKITTLVVARLCYLTQPAALPCISSIGLAGFDSMVRPKAGNHPGNPQRL